MGDGHQPDRNWDSDELLRTFEPMKKRMSPLKICLWILGVCSILLVIAILFRSGEKPVTPPAPVPPLLPEGKQPVDRKSILRPIDLRDRCECRKCEHWRVVRQKPWTKPRKDDYVKGCKSHLMEWHQASSKEDGHLLPGPGERFQHPGVICDVCQKDFAEVGSKLWATPNRTKDQRVLHSWTCYKCVWEDPDRFHTIRNPNTGKITKKHVINHGVDVCGVCAEKCPDQIRTFTDLGPEGKLLHGHAPGDHLRSGTKTSLIGEMRKLVKDEL